MKRRKNQFGGASALEETVRPIMVYFRMMYCSVNAATYSLIWIL